MSITSGEVYIVATPIGNLKDISERALEVLRTVDVIYAEDTRHSARLLDHYGIGTVTKAFHEHNERQAVEEIVARLSEGQKVAIISDAGTPLISDPGFPMVRAVRELGAAVIPVPGACAAIAALSVSGLATDRFVFEGFLPSASRTRSNRLRELSNESRTMVFYEAPHRIGAALTSMIEVFGHERQAMMAREMTKTFETFLSGTLETIRERVETDVNQRKGEIVILVGGAPQRTVDDIFDERLLRALLMELPLKRAVLVASKISDTPKNRLYQRALSLHE